MRRWTVEEDKYSSGSLKSLRLNRKFIQEIAQVCKVPMNYSLVFLNSLIEQRENVIFENF
jgi:hypothetical protein